MDEKPAHDVGGAREQARMNRRGVSYLAQDKACVVEGVI
jgi:hypothetical protein